MSRHDWYRQTEWSEAHAAAFFQRLSRSRSAFHRAQYLRIQALTLAQTRLDSNLLVALELLDRVFTEYPDAWDLSLSHLQAAQCHDELGNVEAATRHFERALIEQGKDPNLGSGVAHQFPWFIARRGLVALYGRALEILARADSVFPYQRFEESAYRAFIAADLGEPVAARASARAALEAATLQRSPFTRHPTVGLVGERYAEWIERLRVLASD